MSPILQVVETCLYAADLEAATAFYRDVLGLELMSREADRHVFFRVGNGMLLLFNPEETEKGVHLPPHGARGAGHVALGIAADSLEAWKRRLVGVGVAIEQEVQWPRGGRSIYFRDPAGNLVELITPGLWGLPSGW